MKKTLLFLMLSIFILNACKKDEPIKPVSLTTNPITSITQTTAISGGNITDDGGGTITARGICWSTAANPTTADNKTNNGTGTGSFSSSLTALTANTTYYVRGYATNTAATTYGNEIQFTTAAGDASLTTNPITDITDSTAISGANITDDGGGTITARGICWSTTANPTTADNKTNEGTGTGSFSSSLTALTANTTYYVRGYATNTAATTYGNEIQFTTAAGDASLTTNPITDITDSTAISGANITDDGGGTITARGVCWSTIANPTTADNMTNNGTGTGSFSSSLTALTANTTYYVRAYATNTAATTYGNEIQFTTLVAVGEASLTTNPITDITDSTAISGANITDDGGGTITARGICWSTIANPTTADNITNNGTGTGSFSSALTGLTANTTYYVRGYATNTAITTYGNQIQFTTAVGDALLTTNPITDITDSTAISGANITDDGGGTITARGICWSTTANPTTADNKTNEGTGTGSFSSALTGLTANTTYYVRGYATNTVATTYGNQIQFTTADKIYTGNVTLRTQQEVNDFAANSYTKVTGDVFIGVSSGSSSSNTTNLTALSSLRTIGGDLYINNNHNLSTLTGLESVTTIGGDLEIKSNDNLSTLTGLESVTTIGGDLYIYNNDNLSTLTGLESVTTIGGRLSIDSNSNLSTLTGLESVTTIGGNLYIGYNGNLSTLTGLESVTTIEGNLSIDGNDNLSTLTGLESVTTIGGNLYIAYNGNLSTLTGLEKITTIGGNLEIGYNTILNNLCGLETVLNNNGLNGVFTVTGNDYNPSKTDIINGNCSQ